MRQQIKGRRPGLSSDVWWRQMCEEYKVRQFYTAPTAIRALMKLGDAPGPAARRPAARDGGGRGDTAARRRGPRLLDTGPGTGPDWRGAAVAACREARGGGWLGGRGLIVQGA